jgi:hypothetical protein
VRVQVPTRLSDRQRELLVELATESGELAADGNGRSAGKARTRKGKRSLGDRIKDAIN